MVTKETLRELRGMAIGSMFAIFGIAAFGLAILVLRQIFLM